MFQISPKRSRCHYRGRFAPSPSGLLHFGSLIAALASYLDAKSNHGDWLLRIDDIDPPREMAGASTQILHTLEKYGLFWDETELYQSSQHHLYQDVLEQLKQHELSYYCQCSRKSIQQAGGFYQGTCRALNRSAENASIRLINTNPIAFFDDMVQGRVTISQSLANEDYIIHRRDGLFAYQLAVVVDDIYQGITHVVRGADLLTPSARQIHFFQTLGFEPLNYAHVPLAISNQGFKLSKQNKAPAIDTNNPVPTLVNALLFLGQPVPSDANDLTVDQLIQWAIKHWQLNLVPKKMEISL